MSNIITIELCAEDRARLDRLTAALEKRVTQEEGITISTTDPVREARAEALEKAAPSEKPQNEPQAAEEPAKTETLPKEETPAAAEEDKPSITLAQVQQKVVQLSAANKGAKKAAVREIVNAYATKVSDLPEDKWLEVWGKLTALEQEG